MSSRKILAFQVATLKFARKRETIGKHEAFGGWVITALNHFKLRLSAPQTCLRNREMCKKIEIRVNRDKSHCLVDINRPSWELWAPYSWTRKSFFFGYLVFQFQLKRIIGYFLTFSCYLEASHYVIHYEIKKLTRNKFHEFYNIYAETLCVRRTMCRCRMTFSLHRINFDSFSLSEIAFFLLSSFRS